MILIHDVRRDRCPNCGGRRAKKAGVEVEWHAPGERVRHFLCLEHLKLMLEGLLAAIDENPSVADGMRQRMHADGYVSGDTIRMLFAAAEKGAVDGLRKNRDLLLQNLERGRRSR